MTVFGGPVNGDDTAAIYMDVSQLPGLPRRRVRPRLAVLYIPRTRAKSWLIVELGEPGYGGFRRPRALPALV